MKFFAALNGVELNEDESSVENKDITALQNRTLAAKEGFGIDEGLGFIQM